LWRLEQLMALGANDDAASRTFISEAEVNTSVFEPSHAGCVRSQGMRLQGMRLQGMRLQGMRSQGMRSQGMRAQEMGNRAVRRFADCDLLSPWSREVKGSEGSPTAAC